MIYPSSRVYFRFLDRQNCFFIKVYDNDTGIIYILLKKLLIKLLKELKSKKI